MIGIFVHVITDTKDESVFQVQMSDKYVIIKNNKNTECSPDRSASICIRPVYWI